MLSRCGMPTLLAWCVAWDVLVEVAGVLAEHAEQLRGRADPNATGLTWGLRVHLNLSQGSSGVC